MKKIGKKLNKFMKLFLAFGLLFNNLSSLSVVFADELDNNNQVVVDDQKTDDNVLPDAKNDEEETPSVETDPTEEPVLEKELVFTASLNENNQIVIKYNKATDLSEESKLVIVEDMKYVDDTTYGGEQMEVELTEVVREALESESGYVVDSAILVDNLFEGTYSAKVTIGEEEKVVDKTIEANGEGIELKLYDSNNTLIESQEGMYFIDGDSSSFMVNARLLNGGISPNDKITIGEEEVAATELFEEGTIAEEVLEGYLHGEFEYNVSFDYNLGETVKSVNETFTIMYGGYQINTGNLNESAKNVGLDDQYIFFGIYETPDNAVYTMSEEGIEDILKDFVGEDGIITYEVSNDDGLLITLTDGRITITYAEAEADEGSIASRLEADSEDVSSGDTFTVKYIVSIDEYYINGFSGLVKYDEELLKLTNINSEISEFSGNNKDGQFLYAGNKVLRPEIIVDETTGDATEEPKEYTILTLTFEALKAGEASISIEDAKFYEMNVYYGSEEDLSTSVVINEATDNSLSSLKVAGQDIALEDDKLEYEITVGNDVTAVDVEAMLANSAATYKVDAPKELVVGENTITIEVTAENGDIKVYTVKVTREAAAEETTEEANTVVTPVSYEEYNTDNREPEVIVTPGEKEQEEDAATEEESDKNNVSRIIIIILILLAIAGLIYLIFKDEDDEETKKANKEIDKLKKEDNKRVDNRKPDNNKKVKKKGR